MRVDVCHRVREAIDMLCSHVWMRGEGEGRGRINFLPRLSHTWNTKELSESLYVLKGCDYKNGRAFRIRRAVKGMKEKTWEGKKNETRKRYFVKLPYVCRPFDD